MLSFFRSLSALLFCSALAAFTREVSNNPSHWPSLMLIGSLNMRQGAVEPAVQALQSALKLAPPRQRWVAGSQV